MNPSAPAFIFSPAVDFSPAISHLQDKVHFAEQECSKMMKGDLNSG